MGQAESSAPEPLGEVPAQPPCALVVVGPSGVGKGTLITRLMQENSGYGFSCSHTTRAPRPGENDGEHYHFTNRERMETGIARGDFLEHAHVHSNIYGTSVQAVRDVATAGLCCVLDIDVQGARQVRAAGLRAIFVFIAPPSLEQLEQRLRGRGTDAEEAIKTRLSNAREELESQKELGLYDYIIVNDDLDRAYEALREVGSQALAGRLPAVPGAASAAAAEQASAMSGTASMGVASRGADSSELLGSRDSPAVVTSATAAGTGDRLATTLPETSQVVMLVHAGSKLGSAVCVALSTLGMRVVAVDDNSRSLEMLQTSVLAKGTPARQFLPIVADLRRQGEVQALAPIVAERWSGGAATALVLCPANEPVTATDDAVAAARCLENGLQAPALVAQRFAETVLAGGGRGQLVMLTRRPAGGPQPAAWPQVATTGLEQRCRALAGPRLGVGLVSLGPDTPAQDVVDAVLHALAAPAGIRTWQAHLGDESL